MPHGFPSSGFTLPSAIVRNKKSHAGIQDQVQVAVEVLSIAGMSDNSVAVSGFFVEAKAHPVQIRQIAELPRVHHLRCFPPQYLSSLVLAVLQMRDHEMLHIRPRD